MFLRRLFWYALPSSLVSVQDSIMVKERISTDTAHDHLITLANYNHFFFHWFGLNPVAKGEIAIRQLVLLSVMHYLIHDFASGDRYKAKADRLMDKAIESGEFELAKKSFDFYAWVFGCDLFYLK